MTTPNEQVVIDFWKAFDRLDLDAALDLLTDDCVHDDKPIRVNTGKAEIRAFFAPQIEGLTSCRAELKATLAVGDMVMNERIDYLELSDGKKVVLPVMGAYEFRDGKIAVWRDYYDINSFNRQVAKQSTVEQ